MLKCRVYDSVLFATLNNINPLFTLLLFFFLFFCFIKTILWYIDDVVIKKIKEVRGDFSNPNNHKANFEKTNKTDSRDARQENQKPKERVEEQGFKFSDDQDFESETKIVGVSAEVKGKWTGKIVNKFMKDVNDIGVDNLRSAKGMYTAKETKHSSVIDKSRTR